MTVWIGYLQWTRQHGTGTWGEPILRPMDTFECKDAILDLSDPDHPREPDWPRVDFIVGNPPFLGYSKLRWELGHTYTEALFEYYEKRIPNQSDLCCYWFERARTEIESGRCRRAGLLATQAIRGGKNRAVLEGIKETGKIFFARSDQPWVLDGAHVNVSMVGFDAGIETDRELDNRSVEEIHADLSASIDVTAAQKLPGHASLSFVGGFTFGSFQVPLIEALDLLQLPNPHGRPNSDVVRPWANGLDILRRPNDMWVIDFGVAMEEAEAAKYEEPFRLIRDRVKPERDKMRRKSRRERWWLHGETAQRLRAAMAIRRRVLVTPRVAKFRIFRFLGSEYCIDGQLVAFASEDWFLMGLLQSRIHETWALRQGTQLEDRPRYTPTTCFQTFPFPEPTEDQKQAIAQAAQELDQLRERWLNPPEWAEEEVLEFPGATDGPWARYVHDPDHQGIGTVRYPRQVLKDQAHAGKLAQRTLTNLYNQRPTWLHHAHQHLDSAVATAYNWPRDLTDAAILDRLLALNLERTGHGGAS